MYTIMFNEETAEGYGVFVESRPSLPSAEENLQIHTLPGRDGDLYVRDGTVKDVEIPINFNFSSDPVYWMEKLRNVKRWLNSNGSRKLYFGDSPEWFYKVKNIVTGDCERRMKRKGSFTAVFVCEGYSYLEDGSLKTNERRIYNEYDISHPIYYIRGEGVCTLTVNGRTMRANVGQNLTIDTDRKIAYKMDGTLTNTAVTGDYEHLYLQRGENAITISGGFTLETQTNLRCRI